MADPSHIPQPSEPDAGSNTSGGDDGDMSAVSGGLLAQIPMFSAGEHIPRLRYHPRRRSSAASQTSPSAVDGPPDFHRYVHGAYPFTDMSSDARRQNIMAMDRKRRLTGTTQEEGRRRQGPGSLSPSDGGPGRTFDGQFSSSNPMAYSQRRTSSQIPPNAQIIDLTNSPPGRANNPLPPTPQPHLPSTSGDRTYVVPRWQPDSEVSECPICRRPFSFLFRRHHCRKCGRVVCNDCSPHRITIPRQYIVSPPGSESLSEETVRDSTNFSGDGDDQDQHDDNENDTDEDTIYSSALNRRRRRARAHHFSIGGGEKVRLCNPCVPDPQPEHQPNYAAHTLPPPSGYIRRPPLDFSTLPRPGLSTTTRSRDLPEPFPGMSAPNYSASFNPQPISRPFRSHASTFDSFGLPASSLSPAPSSSYHAEHNYSRSGPSRDNPHVSHGRYHSFDQTRTGLHSTIRPRIRSMLEERNNFSRIPPAHGLPAQSARLREEDICPICRRALPPVGPNGDETAREAHIMACISSRDPTAQSLQSGSPRSLSSPIRGPMHMLTFIATEKDCTGDDGGVLECSICMVEYDVGEQLARLECLCKFHRECIVSWFERKQECPVHKIA